MLYVRRAGQYYRICGAEWGSADDTSYSKAHGGRWNPKGEFGALYLNRTLNAAHANARRWIAENLGPTIKPEDVAPAYQPHVQRFRVKASNFVDAVTKEGRKALNLLPAASGAADHRRCHAIARKAYANKVPGVACICAAINKGEELAIFDTHAQTLAKTIGDRVPFAAWQSEATRPAQKRP
jgi:RES domain-containing protein